MKKIILVILRGLFMVCSLPIYSANKPKIQGNTPLEVSSLKQLEALLGSQKIVFIDFYQDSCPPCERFKPLYEHWAYQFGKQIIFIKVNASNPETEDLCKKFEIASLPTLIILNSQGKKIAEHTGIEQVTKISIERFLAHEETQDFK
ncbi:MAG: hypothetical protein C5B45_05270 [Chlamydiae bacterium]|nr:MAG: hypothetical protein C5B45_05270 [Chlamydiota bacterium]